jgi:LPXTG-motif cell wall-anchored protein
LKINYSGSIAPGVPTVTRRLIAALVVVLSLLGFAALMAPTASAVRTTGWATWGPITGTSTDFATTMQLPALGFPRATVATNSRSPIQLPSGASTFLGGATDSVPTAVGTKYGSSRNQPYLNLRPLADTPTAPSTTTYTFDSPTLSTGWTFVLGDIDSDQVQISAKDATGTPLTAAQINQWFNGTFNYAGAPDQPTWNATTATLTGNPTATDTNGASAWFEPNVSLSELTFVFTRRAGFPVYQTWFASVARTIGGTVTDVSSPNPACPIDSATVILTGPNGNQLASVHPSGGAYSFGQYATQPGYTVSIEPPSGCAVVGSPQATVSTAAADATAAFSLRTIIPEPVSGTVLTTTGTAVAGVQITLTPPIGPAVVTTTGPDGSYLLDNNAVGTGYTVAVTGVPAGFTVSGATSRTFDIVSAAVTGQDFTLAEAPSVSGTVTGGGNPLGGVTVTLTPSGGGAAVTTDTAGDGTYVFDHVPAATYDISVTAPTGYTAPAPITGVAVASTDVTGQDFALSRPGSVTGTVTDSTSDGGVAGVTVSLTGPTTQTASTDADGDFFFSGLAAGTYDLTIALPSGYASATPADRTITITAAGEIVEGDFALTASAPAGASLPATGADSETALVGLASIALGVALLGAARRRRPA